jgi:hypothetical protein
MAEMQCRWACEIFARRLSLPSSSAMFSRIQSDAAIVRKRFYGSARHSVQRDTFPYNDTLASEIGCKPPLLSFDVALMCKLWLGTVLLCRSSSSDVYGMQIVYSSIYSAESIASITSPNDAFLR